MKNGFLLLLLLLPAGFLFGQDREEAIIDEFFRLYKEDIEQAINYIYSTNDWIGVNSDAVIQLKGQLIQYSGLVGEYLGEEFIWKSRLGESFSMFVYLVKYERQPFRFTFEMYKPRDKWILFSFKSTLFDDA